MNVGDKMAAIHASLHAVDIPHAFGGALALAWCTEQARATIDVDVNLFLPPDRAIDVVAALPDDIKWGDDDIALIERDGQARLRWAETPIDLFFSTTAFHQAVADRTRWEPYQGVELPFLDCSDLAVFKAFFNRTKDWADLEAMRDAGTLDIDTVLGVVIRYLGADDERVEFLRRLAAGGSALRPLP